MSVESNTGWRFGGTTRAELRIRVWFPDRKDTLRAWMGLIDVPRAVNMGITFPAHVLQETSKRNRATVRMMPAKYVQQLSCAAFRKNVSNHLNRHDLTLLASVLPTIYRRRKTKTKRPQAGRKKYAAPLRGIDDFRFRPTGGKVHLHNLHATALHLLGLDHKRFTHPYASRDFRLTHVYDYVVEEIASSHPLADERIPLSL